MAIAIDPVCGMEVEMEDAPLTFEYHGTVYYFCARGCLLEFKENPERFLDPSPEPKAT